MRVAVLSSGGKDSSAAWWWATCRGGTCASSSPSWWMGTPDVPGSEHAADATAGSGAGVPWDHRVIDGTEGPDFEALEAMLTAYQLDGFVSGALRSDYQRNRLERLGEALGLRTWTPLWHQRPEDHLRGLAAHGFEVMVTSVSAEGLDASWLGGSWTTTPSTNWKPCPRCIASTLTAKAVSTRPWWSSTDVSRGIGRDLDPRVGRPSRAPRDGLISDGLARQRDGFVDQFA